MDANAQYELNSIKNELQNIIDELYSIANGVNREFDGIGNDKCANSILKAVKQYETVKQKLNTMDLNTVTEEFAAKQRAKAEAEARAKAEAAARARAEAEARARAEAEARARAEAEARARAEAAARAEALAREAEAKAKAAAKEKAKNQSAWGKVTDVLEDAFSWMFK